MSSMGLAFENRLLPQYGLGPDTDFVSIVDYNRFLFRVYTPKLRSPIESSDDSNVYFIAPKFDSTVNVREGILDSSLNPPLPLARHANYEDVVQYMEWTTRSSSPYISASFSFAWAIWEAMKRYRQGIKHDIEVAVIDGSALCDRAITSIELLEKGPTEKRHRDHWKWYKHATESQSVLVYGYIPVTCVYASIPLLTIISNLPSYFMSGVFSARRITDCENLLKQAPWPSVTANKHRFKQFCSAMSNQYRALSPEVRLRDTVTGSVLLALSFLRPWLEHEVLDSEENSIQVAAELAWIISRWPDPHDQDVKNITASLQTMIRALVDEIKTYQVLAYRQTSETTQLRGLMENLQNTVRQLGCHECRVCSENDETGSIFSSPSNTVVHSEPPSPPLKIIIPSACLSDDPTPPTSPLELYRTPGTSFPDPLIELDDLTVTENLLDRLLAAEMKSSSGSSSESVMLATEEASSSDPEDSPILSSDLLTSCFNCQHNSNLSCEDSSHERDLDVETLDSSRRTLSFTPEPFTISYLVTGFLFGAFVTLCILSNQRKTLLTNLT